MQSLKIWLLPILLFSVLLFLQFRLWFEPEGVLDMLRLKKQLTIEQQQNDKLKKQNEKLIKQVEHLHKNTDAIEARARQELGMIKKGETFYQVVER